MKCESMKRALASFLLIQFTTFGNSLAIAQDASAENEEIASESVKANSASLDVVTVEEATLAILTRKAGLGSALAHDHLIYAGEATTSLAVDMDTLSKVEFSTKFAVKSLIVDDPAKQKELTPRLKQLKLREEPYPEVSDSDRKKIYESMLDKDNLDAEKFPEIAAKLVGWEPANPSSNLEENHVATMEFTIHGVTRTVKLPVHITKQDNKFFAEAVGKMKFTDFGIKPVSLFFGAIRNHDEFHIYVNLIATAGAKP